MYTRLGGVTRAFKAAGDGEHLLGSAPRLSARKEMPVGLPNPFSARGTPTYQAAGTPSGLLRAAAEGDETAVQEVTKRYNPAVESVLDPRLPILWAGNFDTFTTVRVVNGYHELRIDPTAMRNGDMLVVLPSRNAQPDVMIWGRGRNGTSKLVPHERILHPSRELFASYTKGRTVSMQSVCFSASQSTTGARTPGFLHGFALSSFRDVGETPNVDTLMEQVITPKDQSVGNDTFDGVASIMAPDAVNTNLLQFTTDQVESDSTMWHVEMNDQTFRVTPAEAARTLWAVPDGEFVLNDRPIRVEGAFRVPHDVTTNVVNWKFRLRWGRINQASGEFEFVDEDSDWYNMSAFQPMMSGMYKSIPRARPNARLMDVQIVTSTNNAGNYEDCEFRSGRVEIAGYLDRGQFQSPTIFMPSAFDDSSIIVLRYIYSVQCIPNAQLMPDVRTGATGTSAMTKEDIEAATELFGTSGPLRRVMPKHELGKLLEQTAGLTFSGATPNNRAFFRAVGANQSLGRHVMQADGFMDFLGGLGKGILGILPVAGQIASAVAPLVAEGGDHKRRRIGYSQGPPVKTEPMEITEVDDEGDEPEIIGRPPCRPDNGGQVMYASGKSGKVTFGGSMKPTKKKGKRGGKSAPLAKGVARIVAASVAEALKLSEQDKKALQRALTSGAKPQSGQLKNAFKRAQKMAAEMNETSSEEEESSEEVMEEEGEEEDEVQTPPLTIVAGGQAASVPGTSAQSQPPQPTPAELYDQYDPSDQTMVREESLDKKYAGQKLRYKISQDFFTPKNQMTAAAAQAECDKHRNSKSVLQAIRAKGLRRRLAGNKILVVLDTAGVKTVTEATLFVGTVPVANNNSQNQYLTYLCERKEPDGTWVHHAVIHISDAFAHSAEDGEEVIAEFAKAQQQIARAGTLAGRKELYFSVVGDARIAGPSCGGIALLTATGVSLRDIYVSAEIEFGNTGGRVLPRTVLNPVGSESEKIEHAIAQEAKIILPWSDTTERMYVDQDPRPYQRYLVSALDLLNSDPPELFTGILAQSSEELIAVVLQVMGSQLGVEVSEKGMQNLAMNATYTNYLQEGGDPAEFTVSVDLGTGAAAHKAEVKIFNRAMWNGLKGAVEYMEGTQNQAIDKRNRLLLETDENAATVPRVQLWKKVQETLDRAEKREPVAPSSLTGILRTAYSIHTRSARAKPTGKNSDTKRTARIARKPKPPRRGVV